MEKLEGQIAYLPDGQKVTIEYVADGVATVRRVGGEWDAMVAVCDVKKLEPTSPQFPHQELQESAGE